MAPVPSDNREKVLPEIKPIPASINEVILIPGSVKGALAGSEKIIVPSGKKYKIIFDGQVKYVKANGELSDNERDAVALIGREIIGLTNGKQYRVEEIAQSYEENLIKNSKVELKSGIARHGVRGVWGNEQQSHITIDVFGNNGLIQNDQDITIAGKTVRVNRGDNPNDIKFKIIAAFQNDKNWIAGNIFPVVQGNRPVRVTLTSKAYAKNEDNLAIDNSEIRFSQVDSMYGRASIEEVTEICNVIVTGVSNKQETINVNVTGEKNPSLNQTVSVDVKPTDTTKDVAKSIYNAFQANEVFKAVYRMKLDEANSRIILIQNLGDLLDTKVTIK